MPKLPTPDQLRDPEKREDAARRLLDMSRAALARLDAEEDRRWEELFEAEWRLITKKWPRNPTDKSKK